MQTNSIMIILPSLENAMVATPVLLSAEWIGMWVFVVAYVAFFLSGLQLKLENGYRTNQKLLAMPTLPDLVRDNICVRYWETYHLFTDWSTFLVGVFSFLTMPTYSVHIANMYSMFMTYRFVACNVTLMPSPSEVSDELWKGGERSPRSFGHDVIVSGHTGMMTLCWWTAFATASLTPLALTLFALAILACALFVILSHQHYTVDVLLGATLATFTACIYF